MVERLNDLHDRLAIVNKLLNNLDTQQELASEEIDRASDNVTLAENQILEARKELAVSYISSIIVQVFEFYFL